MSSSKITLFGLYQWLKVEGVDLFDSFNLLPDMIDKGTLENVILTEGGEFEPLFADAPMMKSQVDVFTNKHLRTFTKWCEALEIKYNPLENYDRQEEWTDDGSNNTSTSNDNLKVSNGQSSESSYGSSSAHSQGTTTGSVDNTVSAYDSSNMSPHDSSATSTTTGSSGGNSSSGNTSGNTSETTRDNFNENVDGTTHGHHVGRTHGNVGVTTSQQMLQSELDIATFNLYHNICDLFIDELLIGVYV